MKISRLVELAENKQEPIAAPSPVHVAFVQMLGQLCQLGKGTGHPAAKLMERLLPSLLRDIADIPAADLARMCRRIGVVLVEVAEAEEGTKVELLEPVVADSEPVPDQPALTQG